MKDSGGGSDGAKPPEAGPFRSHSTLLGLSAALVVVTILGWLTHWRESLVPLYLIVGLASLWFLARVFYGLHSAMLLDKALGSRGLWWVNLGRWDGSIDDKNAERPVLMKSADA